MKLCLILDTRLVFVNLFIYYTVYAHEARSILHIDFNDHLVCFKC